MVISQLILHKVSCIFHLIISGLFEFILYSNLPQSAHEYSSLFLTMQNCFRICMNSLPSPGPEGIPGADGAVPAELKAHKLLNQHTEMPFPTSSKSANEMQATEVASRDASRQFQGFKAL